MARAAAREPAPRVTLVRSLTVENVDSIGLVPGMKVLGAAVRVLVTGRQPGCTVRPSGQGVPGESAWAGRSCTMGYEPALVDGRPCDVPGCVVSAIP